MSKPKFDEEWYEDIEIALKTAEQWTRLLPCVLEEMKRLRLVEVKYKRLTNVIAKAVEDEEKKTETLQND